MLNKASRNPRLTPKQKSGNGSVLGNERPPSSCPTAKQIAEAEGKFSPEIWRRLSSLEKALLVAGALEGEAQK